MNKKYPTGTMTLWNMTLDFMITLLELESTLKFSLIIHVPEFVEEAWGGYKIFIIQNVD